MNNWAINPFYKSKVKLSQSAFHVIRNIYSCHQSKPEVVPELKKETIVVSRDFEKDLMTTNQNIDTETTEPDGKDELLKIAEQESTKGKRFFSSYNNFVSDSVL